MLTCESILLNYFLVEKEINLVLIEIMSKDKLNN